MRGRWSTRSSSSGVGKRVAQLLGTPTDDGFVYRVDLRLRPFGDSGPVAVSFDAMEDYLQQHGRDWERYAYVKARPVYGAEPGFAELYRNALRPFVYRRYLDFGVFESLRAMKELIAREVERRELQQNVKLGPGGIREIEFIVQAFQLLRGGSTPRLQTRSLLEALPQLAGQKLLPQETVAELQAAYRFLRRVENRLQEWNDEQTHELPVEPRGARAARAGHGDARTGRRSERELQAHRDRVSAHFQRAVFAPGATADDDAARHGARAHAGSGARRQPARRERLAALQAPGAGRADAAAARPAARERVLPPARRDRPAAAAGAVAAAVARCRAHAECGSDASARVLHVLERIGGRTVYLALLNENAVARERLLELCAHSQFLADQIAAFPLLLDELLDDRLFVATPTRAELAQELRNRMAKAARTIPRSRSRRCGSSSARPCSAWRCRT